ncbi:MAG: dioxygenase [Betaproteobacteria bacterium]|nr:MAG: dioxygenase [Betaproteobacteria bacterium]TMH69937.1 MAG: dioxygenase [Betaproteobacteria bacterium]
MKRLPTLFLSHGSPMHAIAPGEAGRVWAALGQTLKPRAVLVASAHWETAVPMVTGSPKPQTIHDFGGFPAQLYEIQYPARGAPELAEEIVGLLKQAGITAGIDGCRGLDHGAWVPLRHMFPVADVPIVQISVQPERGTAHHVELGRALAPLAADNVLIVGSGHATHNLRDFFSARAGSSPLTYARDFADWLHTRLLSRDIDALVRYRDAAPSAERAHPTEEHFLPLFVAWGAAGDGARAERIVEGLEAGALSMDSYAFHADAVR